MMMMTPRKKSGLGECSSCPFQIQTLDLWFSVLVALVQAVNIHNLSYSATVIIIFHRL